MLHRNHVAIFFTAVGSLLIAGCSISQPDPGEPLHLERIIIEPYQHFTASGINDARREVVRDHATWVALWEEIWSHHSEAPELPVVDFSQEMVAFVSMGSQNTSGYYIELEAAFKGLNSIDIHAVAVRPAKNCFVFGSFTAPVDIARMPRVEQPVTFAVQSGVHRCD